MPKYRKKPVVIEARQLTDANYDEACEIVRWAGGRSTPDGFIIDTLEGPLHVSFGDYVICGVKGEFYPCKPDIFEATYDLVEEEELAHHPV